MDFGNIDLSGTGSDNGGNNNNANNNGAGGGAVNSGADTTNLNGNGDAVDINANNNNGGNNNNGDNNGNNGGTDNNGNGGGSNNNGGTDNNNNNGGTGDGNGNNNGDGNGNDNHSSTGELNPGDTVSADGNDYTVDENGNLVDKDGKIFKQASEVQDWLKEFEVDDDSNTLDINNIKTAIGIDITDEKGNAVEFTNDVDGIKKYLNSVIELKTNEIQQATVNKIFEDNPLVKQFIDYCQVTGTYKGFGEIPDRSGIEINKDNVQQQEYIIRMAAEEFGNKSLNDNYIKYLKDTGGLYDEAKAQLAALVQKDNDYKKQIAEQAEQSRVAEQAELQAYWKSISDAIDGRVIAGHKLPETIVRERDGKKVTLTMKDFYDYLSRPVAEDENKRMLTGYQKDLRDLSDKDALEREILDAYLMFSGGSYKDLVDIAIREEKAKKLQLVSKENRTRKTVVITKPKGKVNRNDILL